MRVEVVPIGDGKYEVRLPPDYAGSVTLHCTGGAVKQVKTVEVSRPRTGKIDLTESLDKNPLAA